MNTNTAFFPAEAVGVQAGASADFGESSPHLVFDVGTQPYACPIGQIQRLLRRADAAIHESAAPEAAWEAGRLATEDSQQEIPVVSLRALWGLPQLTEAQNSQRQAILIVNVGGKPHALLVDGCRRVIPRLPQGQARFQMTTPIQSSRGRAFKLATPWEDSILVVLTVDNLLDAQPAVSHRAVEGVAQ